MEYFLTAQGVIDNDLGIIEYVMPCYNTLDDPEFSQERKELLQHRSALELVRDQLSDAQCLEMTQIDDYWRSNPDLFNRAFARHHGLASHHGVLRGYVSDGTGNAPDLPGVHWWWRPIPLSARP